MRHNVALASLLLVTALGLSATMCSSPEPSSASPADVRDLAGGRFRGVVNGPGEVSGVLDLTATATTTASAALRPQMAGSSQYALAGTLTLNVSGLGPVSVSGTLDLATNTATFSGTAFGGTVPFSGTYAAGMIVGTATFPSGPAPFQVSNERLGIKTYCGSFSGGLAGRWSMLTAGNQAGVVFASGDGRSGRGRGTIDGSLVTLALDPEPGSEAGSATGTSSAGMIDGTWRHAGLTGAFAVSEAACNALTPAGTSPDGGVLDGGGPEAGPPGTPQTIYTVPGAVNVAHLALAGTKVVYSLDHPYFSQRVTIGSINTDGTSPVDVIPTNDPQVVMKKVVGGLTATATKVFYVAGTDPPDNDANLMSVATSGGTVTDHGVIGAASNRDFVNGVSRIVNDGTTVFVTNDGSSTDNLRSYSMDGTPGPLLADLVGPTGMGVDGSNLYFGDFGGLERVAKALTPAPVVFADKADFGALAFVVNVAFDVDNIYFVTNTTNASGVWRKPKAGGATAPVVASTPARIRGLAVLGGFLYYSSAVSGGGQQGGTTATLMRVDRTATNATAVSVGPASSYDVLTDGTYVYWGDGTRLQRVR